MSNLIDELVAHGFEVIRDDSGQDLVKLVFMDENDDATGCALVTPEDAKKILSGQATLQNAVDEEGKQVLTLTPIADGDLEVVEQPKADLPSEHSTSAIPAELGGHERHKSNNEEVIDKDNHEAAQPGKSTVSELCCDVGDSLINSGEVDTSDVNSLVENVEQYTLSEQTAVVDNGQVQVVTIIDSRGQVLDQKQGQTGEQVILEMHGQAFSYEIQGPTSTGEPITSTLLISTNDQDIQDVSNTAEGVTQQNINGQTNWSEGVSNGADRSHVTSGFDEITDANPSGQQFTLTEATTLVDGEALQLVILSDENGNVLDQKQGHTGDHVIIEMNGSSLEYVFLGPTETGDPILTTLVVTTETEMTENTQPNFNVAQESPGDTEAGSTVAKWCPPGLPSEFYAILRRQAEVVVSTRVPRFSDNPYRPEPYHRKLGPYTAYVEMLEMVNSYRVGASQGETLELYEALRNYAKIYRPSGPHSRALTKYELALNEAAAQICRFQPGLLFHKRDLYHLAKETVERSQTLLNTERRQQNQQLQQQAQQAQQQQTQAKQNMNAQRQANQTNMSKPKVSLPTSQPPRTTPQTVAVGGRVASSQLAMLESRGLSGIQQSSTVVSTASSVTSIHENSNSDNSLLTSNLQGPGVNSLQSNKPRVMTNDSTVQYLSSLPIAKRDSAYKLLPNEEEAIRIAAVDVLSDMPQLQIKPKADCTNIERACWDQARQLSAQSLGLTDYHSGNSSIDHINQIQSLVSNELRLDSVREAAALYGRLPGGIQPPNVAGLPRSTPVPVLTPYEIACNEAASYLASGLPSLLTHRRELAELAKKVVRNSGCLFTHTPTSDKIPVGGGGYRFYCSDQLLELDLSAAEQLLSNPLDGSDSPDSGCDVSLEDSDTDALSSKCESLVLTCQECNNVVDDITIFISTGTDSLKKVRILNLSDCGFTGIVPAHLNQCVNLVELNLSGNALYAFPRCLHLPKLRRLNLSGNPNLLRPTQRGVPVEPPLVEQFPRLVTLDLDPELALLLSPQSLAYLCPYLKTINGKDFIDEPTEDTINTAQTAKNDLSALIYSKWEDDIAGFYKKGLPKRDTICVIETLVLHAVNRSLEISQPFTHCKNILARRIAEDFLAPKMLDDECEDETLDKFTHTYISDDEGAASDSELDTEEEDDSYCKENNHIEKNSENQMNESLEKSHLQMNSCSVSTGTMRKKPKKIISTEAFQASVAEREALAAAANLTLLPDEPPNRLINVVGQALRHGKTVVYEVMRTAARQPDGELIPVGGLGTTASSTNLTSLQTNSQIDGALKNHQEDMYDESDTENTSLPESIHPQPPAPAVPTPVKTAPVITKLPTKQPTGTRRPGLLSRVANTISAEIKGNRSSVVSTGSLENSTSDIPTITQRRLKASDFIIKPSTSSSGTAYIVANVATQAKPTTPSSVTKRGRPAITQTLAKKAAVAESEAKETEKLLKSVTIPPPHAPPPPTMRMSTRDSNRHKRFSAYGVIDTAAALAGKEEALLAAVLAQEDEDNESPETLLKDSSVVLSEYDTAAAEAVAAVAKEDEVMEQNNQLESQPDVTLNSTAIEQTAEPLPNTNDTEEGTKKKRKRVTGPQTPRVNTEPSVVNIESETPTTTQTLTRKRTAISPKPQEPKRKSTSTHSPLSVSVNLTPVDLPPVTECKRSLSQLGEIVDYDPLHFIRCHARDNDPLDCETKVWRCAFEPSVNNPSNETSTIVATCGGECVCLIDCKSGRVMKRFKHFGEEFYTLAWTTVEMAAGHRTNLLAAAGKLREIRLLHPEQLVCYAEMRGHKDDVACMIFHPEKPTILFSGDSKSCILVWDIGIPSAPEYKTRHQLLMRLVCPRANLNPVLNLVFLKKYDALVAGCEDGIFSWTLKDFRKEKLSDEKEAEIELKVPTRREPCFDGLAQLSDDLIVTKCVEEGEIYVINFGQVVNRRRRSGASNKKVINVEIRGQLRWHTTEEIYINVTARPGLHAVICGDNEGTIWLYDLQKQVIDESENRKFKSKPVKILEWPECSIGGAKDEDNQIKESITSGFKNPVVNTTDISHDGQYLVAVTDNNLVCIWKFSG